MSGKTFACFVYEHAALDQIDDAIDALQDAPVLDWVEITLPGDSWISVVKGHDGFPVTERGTLVQTPITATSARRYVGRMLYERFKGVSLGKAEAIKRALGGTCDACKQLGSHANVCPIGGSFGGYGR